MNNILIIKKQEDEFLEDLVVSDTVKSVNFETIVKDDIPKTHEHSIVVYKIDFTDKNNKEKLIGLIETSNASLYGFDVKTDAESQSIFDHLFVSNENNYDDFVTMVGKLNLSMVPTNNSDYNFVIGIAGNFDDIYHTLPKYDKILYGPINSSNTKLYGYDAVIINGKIEVSFMLAILISCKPYVIYKEDTNVSRYIIDNMNWGRQFNEHIVDKWWKSFNQNIQKNKFVSLHEYFVSYTDEMIVSKLNNLLDIDCKLWYYGKDVLSGWNSEQYTPDVISTYVVYLKTKTTSHEYLHLITDSITNKTLIDISLLDFGIENKFITPIITNKIAKVINLDPYLSNYTHGVHRSGWKYVVEGLMTMSRNSRKGGIIFDTCVEQTFLWNKDILIVDKKIPYTENWMGIIHHTFSEHCGVYNLNLLFESQEFLLSLEKCKCLIVMSNYLAKQLSEKLEQNKGITVPPIKVVLHPTEFVNSEFIFNMTNFKKTVTHVGDFLRNKKEFFNIKTGSINKQYLVPPTKSKDLISNNICCDNVKLSCSSWNDISYLSSNIDLSCSSIPSDIETIGPYNNDEYDKLLASTIVFINLYDASACNTLIECIVRQTPIIVNRHPAVVEYIGDEYPGLYDNIDDVRSLFTMSNIVEMHKYLKNHPLIKDKLSIKTFLTNINQILEDID